ncbi:RluA family pseudouridine synthase [Desulfoprunum benzoelyticum]|uniref:tRNA pseudouridine32 synthase/23S rRNA pseudouridine746 synthase n=1 Tax=Desulfoprunum benzoelyticum TaxID=1506996 RepID=A0A840UTI8_9BACT|nr:RluA family pseudouridine synthase [Desulfoprunum benzoelyticum]MBB5349112.1 tRNA pseudouridine32 synthase/23S rRNA pseudouridine746 synthase [Desulfoprunum benzoelyticum]MBM9530649.1 RluA family pseudouridine synthase [Desulfoprunum benzoelyticum]
MPVPLPDPVIIYRDAVLLVVGKPAGLLAVPGRGPDKQDCVVARLRPLAPAMIAQPAVHRLDMATSGLMILAITAEAHRRLSRQFETRQVRKRYTAILDGIVAAREGEIRLPFRLDPANRPYQIHDPIAGKMGITTWRRLALEGNRTRVEFTPLTGRTHQLRVHAAHRLGLGIPIVGDRLYGRGDGEERMLLHASFLALSHPVSGTPLAFASPAPF